MQSISSPTASNARDATREVTREERRGRRRRRRRRARQRRVLLLALLVLVGLGARTPDRTRSYEPSAGRLQPAAGRLLVATPELAGPFFSQTVILLLHYDWTGAVGVVINRPSDVRLSEFLPELETRDDFIYLGGPVETKAMAFLVRHRVEELLHDLRRREV